MGPEDWLQRWREGKIGFHEAAPNGFLVAHAARLAGTVFLPLCGKSRDMAHLASLGHRIVGAELSGIAAEAFFSESSITPERSTRGGFEVLSAGGVSIFVGDVFALTSDLIGPIDTAYDRAALVAVAPDEQARYAAHLASLGPRTILLVTFDYDQTKMEGPPFSVSDARARELFSRWYSCERLDARDVTDERPRFREAGIDRVTETLLLLQRVAS